MPVCGNTPQRPSLSRHYHQPPTATGHPGTGTPPDCISPKEICTPAHIQHPANLSPTGITTPRMESLI
jgi:hypothetical protein